VEIAADQTTEGWLLLPDGTGPFPAVLVPFYDPETSIGLSDSPFRDFALQLARRGFVTLSIGSPGGDARAPDPGIPGWQPLSFLAYIAANCHTALAQHPAVDPRRIGIVGHSYGGKWAMFAACLDERFACAAWSDPGIVFDDTRPNVNYWEPWYLGRDPRLIQQRRPGLPTAGNPTTGAYRIMRESGRDLHELHALMSPRPFLVSGGSEDPPERWIPLNHTRAVNQLLRHTHRVAMSNRSNHSPDAKSNEQIYSFFEHFLQSQRNSP
jgi:dienelactone hydrolase